MPPEACAPRLQELHARQTDIQSRIERISADLNDDGPGITSLEEVKSVAAELADMLETYEDEDIPKLKELLRIVVKEILVNSRILCNLSTSGVRISSGLADS